MSGCEAPEAVKYALRSWIGFRQVKVKHGFFRGLTCSRRIVPVLSRPCCRFNENGVAAFDVDGPYFSICLHNQFESYRTLDSSLSKDEGINGLNSRDQFPRCTLGVRIEVSRQ